MKVVAIIPSRFGSTRFQAKPLALIAGKPMIQRVYERASGAKSVREVFVATDDQRIFNVVEAFGGKAIMTSASNRSGTDRVAEAAEKVGLDPDDIVVNVQGDQPLLDSRCIDQLLKPFASEPDLEMSTLAFRIVDPAEIGSPKDVKVTFSHLGDALYFSRSPIPFSRDDAGAVGVYKHLGFYAYPRKFLEIFRNLPSGKLEQAEKLEQLRALEFGHRIRVVVTEFDSPEVDLPEDIERIERMIRDKVLRGGDEILP